MRHSLLAVSLLAACTTTDPDLTCDSLAFAPADHMDGFVLEEVGGAPIAGALVESVAADGQVARATTTDLDGTYQMTGSPGAYRHAAALDHLDAYLEEPALAETLPLPMLSLETANRFAADPAHTTLVLVLPRDCAGTPIAGARVRVAGASEVRYLGADTKFDRGLDATSTDAAAMVIGAPEGEIDVIVAIDGVELHRTVTARTGALVTTWVAP